MYRGSDNSSLCPSLVRCIYRRGIVLLWASLLISWLPQYVRPQSVAEEYQVKAAFLFHFAQFVDWPPGVLNNTDSSLILCIFDDEPRRLDFLTTIEGKAIGTRVLHVRQIDQSQEVQGCNILFLSRDEAQRQSAILRSLRGMPVLTVGETDNFLSNGGMIRFHLDEDKIRFDINLDGAESSHLKISSRLLLLATSVTQSSTADRRR
jgi:YfiR/HmsC-like